MCLGTDWQGGLIDWPLTFLTQRNVVVLVHVLFEPPQGAPTEHQMNVERSLPSLSPANPFLFYSPSRSKHTHGPNSRCRPLWRPRVKGEPQLTFNHPLTLWLIKEKQITSSIVTDWWWRKSADASPRYVLYTHLGLVRGNGGGGVYDVIKKCQKRSAWEQVVCGAAAIKDSCSFHSLPQMLTPQTEHYSECTWTQHKIENPHYFPCLQQKILILCHCKIAENYSRKCRINSL